MSEIEVDIDIIQSVYNTPTNTFIGSRSKYTTTPHPISGKTITGWKWDERWWPNISERDLISGYVPSLWDPDLSMFEPEQFQSGCGDNNDVMLLSVDKVEISGDDHMWAPVINHGYFYVADEEWYLYSDDFITQYATITGIDDNDHFYIDMDYDYRPTIPIQARRFLFDFINGRHRVDLDVRKKVEFDLLSDDEQFIVDNDFDPPRITFLSSGIFKTVGQTITTASGYDQVEILGRSNGEALQEFHTTYSPIDRDSNIQVWVFGAGEPFTEYTIIENSSNFTPGSGIEVKVDYDRGTVSLGDAYDGNPEGGDGYVPLAGANIGITYTATVALTYEPEYSRDVVIVDDDKANVSPARTGVSQGFAQTTAYTDDADSILLGSTLPRVNPFLINLGNNVGLIYAQVRSTSGALLAGQEVLFKILDPSLGNFGGIATEITAVTNTFGEAKVFYNAPAVANDLGQATIDVVHDGPDTVLTIENLPAPGVNTGITLMKIHQSDDVLGIAEDEVDEYYAQYLSDNNLTVDPDGSVASREFEAFWRSSKAMQTIATYTPLELKKGKKTVLLISKPEDVMDPHTGYFDANPATASGVLSPLYPELITDIGTTEQPVLQLRYTNITLPLPGTEDTKAYFAVGDGICQLQAFVVNKSTGRRIASNIIQMKVLIPSTINGSFFAQSLNDLPPGLLTKVRNVLQIPEAAINATSGIEDYQLDYMKERIYDTVTDIYETYYDWFIRTRKADTQSLVFAEEFLNNPALSGLELINPVDVPSEIPLGFRLKSQGINFASILDQVTFLDPNDTLPSGYYST